MGEFNLPDAAQRGRVIKTQKNVIINAGAGTGKTYTLVKRILQLVAPDDPAVNALPVEKIAAITFTRLAAGELKTRLRSFCLEELEDETDNKRKELLRRTLNHIDQAFIGTIHSFADRLLREYPIESNLSPDYQIAEDISELTYETFRRLMAAVRTNTLDEELESSPADISRAEQTVRVALEVGIPEENSENPWGTTSGLEGLVNSWISGRDQATPLVKNELNLGSVKDTIKTVIEKIEKLPDNYLPGPRFLKLFALPALKKARAAANPADCLIILNELYSQAPMRGGRGGSLSTKTDFPADKRYQHLHTSLQGKPYTAHDVDYSADIIKPLRRWLASRLVELRPLAIEMYEKVKRENAVLDQQDLLIKLRNLLKDDRAVRHRLKKRFEHILVDEFQDTDPIQCEIVFFLCEDTGLSEEKMAARWDRVKLGKNRLTVVGDAKQSIYRFRGADIEIYNRAVQVMRDQDADEGELVTNFRTSPELIDSFNSSFSAYFSDGEQSSPAEVDYHELKFFPGFKKGGGRLTLLRYDHADGNVGIRMPLEARTAADYIEWLTGGESDREIRDPDKPLDSGETRPVRRSDIAILNPVTTHFEKYLREFSRRGIACEVAGGATFLRDDFIKQFVLALRAVADRSDGVAAAALKRPPFFAVDYEDLLAGRLDEVDGEYEKAAARSKEMEYIIKELRKKSRYQPPLETALELINLSIAGRFFSSQPNGDLKLAAMYHVAALLDRIARNHALDYEGATAVIRDWIDNPADLNAPALLDDDAVNLMTIYQAKGLEFPVVMLFNGLTKRSGRYSGAFGQQADGSRCTFNLKNFKLNINNNHLYSWKDFDRRMCELEKKRLFYVAITRAQSELVVPWPEGIDPAKYEYPEILKPALEDDCVHETPSITYGDPNPWTDHPEEDLYNEIQLPEFSEELQQENDLKLRQLRKGIKNSLASNLIFTNPHKIMEKKFPEAGQGRPVRYGPKFGLAVHRALELYLQSPDPDEIEKYAAVAAREQEEVDEFPVVSDVKKALAALEENFAGSAADYYPEFPVTYRRKGEMVSGLLDLIVRCGDETWIIDYKTDPAPESQLEARENYPHYFHQLKIYKHGLSTSTPADNIKTALLFTETGIIVES